MPFTDAKVAKPNMPRELAGSQPPVRRLNLDILAGYLARTVTDASGGSSRVARFNEIVLVDGRPAASPLGAVSFTS